MILFVFGAILLILGIIALFIKIPSKELQSLKISLEEFRSIICMPLLITGVACLIGSCCKIIPPGYSVVTTFGTYEAGVYFDAPWRNVIIMDNRAQKTELSLSCSSSDIQEVTVTYTVKLR